MSTIRIMLVDDHAVVRSGLRRMLEQSPGMEVVAEADSGEQAYQLFGKLLPDVAVMDLSMPGMGGLETLKRILARHPGSRVLVFSMHENAAFASQALKAGAVGYVNKASAPDELALAIHEVMRGKVYLSARVAQNIAMEALIGENGPIQQLSSREFEIFRLMVEGKSTEEIGNLLKISQKTVANQATLIKQKLGVSNSIEMIRMAMRYGIVEG